MPKSSDRSSSSAHRFKPFKNQSDFIALLCLSGIISIFLGKILALSSPILIPNYLLSLLLVISIFIFIKKPILGRALLLIICCLTLYVSSSNFQNSLKVYGQLFGKEVSLVGVVQDDAAYNDYGDYEFNITRVNFAKSGEYLPGRIRVRTKQNIAVYRGYKIYVNGTIKPALGARTGSISYSSVEILQQNSSQLERYRLRFFSSIYSSLPEPHASLGIGFLAGVRSSIPKDLQDQLSRVGLTHIIAVSGYNLTIIVLAIGRLGKKLSKYQQTIVSLSLIFLFLLVTGFSPSVVRAAVVCLISIICSYYGRKISPINLILLSAFITSAVNPTYLLEDIGWWLSFLAFFGVLVLAPTVTNLFYSGTNQEPGLLASVFIESLCAQIMTAPLIAHIFGTFSVISLVANILVVPWIPFVMLLVLVVGIFGMLNLNSVIARLFYQTPKIVLTPIILVIQRLSSLPWASVQLKLSQPGMISCYLLIGIFIKISRNRLSRNSNRAL